nr:hypothetical protein [Tanacetum cinerariifolium]
MHNNIMAAGSRDRPSMLAPGRYAQWRSPKPATETSKAVEEHCEIKTFANMSDANKAHFKAGKEAIYMLLTGIRNEIYSIVDACNTSHEMWIAIERNKHVDTSLRYVKDNQTGQFGNQRTVTVAGARETVGSQVVQQNGIQCFNCKEFGHFAKECKKPKRAEKVDWLEDKGEEVDEQELEAHYSFMAKIQEVLPTDLGTDAEPLEKVQYDDEYNVFANEKQHSEQPDSINNTFVVEKVDRNVIPDLPDMCDNNDQAEQNAKECDDERAALANLIANLTLDVEENKKILKQLKKANTSLSQELKECKYTLEETTRALGESNSTRDICLIALQSHKVELENYKTYLNHPIKNDKLELERNLKETLGLLAQKENDTKEASKLKAYELSVVKRNMMS